MATFYVSITTSYPAAEVDEVVEVRANTPEEAERLVLEGGGWQVSTNIELGEADEENVTETVEIPDDIN